MCLFYSSNIEFIRWLSEFVSMVHTSYLQRLSITEVSFLFNWNSASPVVARWLELRVKEYKMLLQRKIIWRMKSKKKIKSNTNENDKLYGGIWELQVWQLQNYNLFILLCVMPDNIFVVFCQSVEFDNRKKQQIFFVNTLRDC